MKILEKYVGTREKDIDVSVKGRLYIPNAVDGSFRVERVKTEKFGNKSIVIELYVSDQLVYDVTTSKGAVELCHIEEKHTTDDKTYEYWNIEMH